MEYGLLSASNKAAINLHWSERVRAYLVSVTCCVPKPKVDSVPINRYVCTEIIENSGHIILKSHAKETDCKQNTKN